MSGQVVTAQMELRIKKEKFLSQARWRSKD
jgi:hypothetical protein